MINDGEDIGEFYDCKYNSTVKIKEQSDTSASKNGVYVFFDETEVYTDKTVTPNTITTFGYNAEGLADDNGGFLQTTYTCPSTTSIMPDKYFYKETFDGTGNLVKLEYNYNDGSGWQTEFDNTTNTAYFDEYTSETTYIDEAQTETDQNSDLVDGSVTSSGSLYFTVTESTTGQFVYDQMYVIYGTALNTNTYSDITTLNSGWANSDQVLIDYIGYAYCSADGTLDIYFNNEQTTGTPVYAYLYDYNTDTFAGAATTPNDICRVDITL